MSTDSFFMLCSLPSIACASRMCEDMLPAAAGEPPQLWGCRGRGLPPPMMVECVGETTPNLSGGGFGGDGRNVI